MFYKKAWAVFVGDTIWTWRNTKRDALAVIKSMKGKNRPPSYQKAKWFTRRIEIRELKPKR